MMKLPSIPRIPIRFAAVAMLVLLAPGFAPVESPPALGVQTSRSVEPRQSSADSLRLRLSFAERLHLSWARATIIRTLDADALDIIVVSPETTVADLDKAVRMLLSSYATTELPLRDEIRGHVSATSETPEPGDLVAELTRGLEQVRGGETFQIRDFGNLPSIVVDLPVEVEWYEPPA